VAQTLGWASPWLRSLSLADLWFANADFIQARGFAAKVGEADE
jgi:hypothetical protein